MVVKVKKVHPDAQLPQKAHEDEDAGWDVFSVQDVDIYPGEVKYVDIGIRIELPIGYYWEIHTRSSFNRKNLSVYPGIIDNGYRGMCDIVVKNLNREGKPYHISKGDKVAQILIRKQVDMGWKCEEVEDLSEAKRGEKGFGSSGK